MSRVVRSRGWTLVGVLASLAWAALGCGAPAPTEPPGAARVLGSVEVGPQGGRYQLGPVTLQLGPGAVSQPVVITASQAAATPAGLASAPITLTPRDLLLQGRAELGIHYGEAGAAPLARDSLSLGRALPDRYGIVAGAVHDPDRAIVGGPITELGTFAAVRTSDASLAIPPLISKVRPSTSALAAGVATPVTWEWEYARTPDPQPTCTLEPSGHAVTPGATLPLTIAGPTEVTLVCRNAAGQGSVTVSLDTAVAPRLERLTASPPALPGQALPVTFAWKYATPPRPAPVCTVDHGVGQVKSGETRTVQLPLDAGDRTFTVTCTNNAGSDTASVTLGAAPDTFPTLAVTPAGGTYDFGLVSINVPPGAVREPVDITLRWATAFSSSPGLVGLPIDFGPSGLVFEQPIEVTYYYDPAYVEALGITDPVLQLHAAYDTPEGWRRIYSRVDTDRHTVTAYVSHFSTLAYDTTRNDAEIKPTASAFQVVAKAEEPVVVLPGAQGNTRGQVWQDLSEAGTSWTSPQSLGNITDTLCVSSGLGGEVVKVVGADVDGDGRQEIAVLCLYTVVHHASPFNEDQYVDQKRFKLVVLDDAQHNYARLVSLDSGSWSDGAAPSGEFYYDADLVKANLDNDLADELVLTASYASEGANYSLSYDSAYVWILDDAVQGFALLEKSDHPDAIYVRLAAGNVDEDEADEIVLGWSNGSNSQPVVRAWDDKAGNFVRLKQLTNLGSGTVFQSQRYATSVAAADVDGDGRAEIVVTVSAPNDTKVLQVYDDQVGNWGQLTGLKSFTCGSCSWDTMTPAQMVAADVDGDYIQDVALLMYNLYGDVDNPYTGWVPFVYRLWYRPTAQQPTKVDAAVRLRGAGANDTSYGTVFDDYRRATLAVGDVDQDRKDEILIAHWLEPDQKCVTFPTNSCTCYSPGKYQVSKIDVAGKTDVGTRSDYSKSFATTCDEKGGRPVVGVSDVDGDDIHLQYTGNYDPHAQSDPMPVVAMAAPPHFRALIQNYKQVETNTRLQDTGGSQYGQGTYAGVATSQTVGITNGTTHTLQAGVSWGAFSAGAGMTDAWDESYSTTTKDSEQIAYGTNYSGSATEDHLVFLIQHFISYEYRILGHPDPSMRPQYDAGTNTWSYTYMSIDVPDGDPVPYNWSTRQFVTTYPQFASWLDGVFDHVPGFPETYPDHAAVDALIKNPTAFGTNGGSATDDPNDPRFEGWWDEGGRQSVPIGENSGTEAYYELTTEKTTEERSTKQHTTSWSYSLPFVGTHGSSQSQFFESSYELSAGSQVRYAGTVGSVVTGCFDLTSVSAPAVGPCASYDAWPYEWNIFVYNYVPAEASKPPFQVVNFWVDDTFNSTIAYWNYYDSFARATLAPSLAAKGDWALGPHEHVTAAAINWDVCGLVNGSVMCRDNPLYQTEPFDNAGLLLFEASFDEPAANEFVFVDGKVAENALAPAAGLKLQIRYRVTGTAPALQGAELGVVPLDPSQYWSFHRFFLAAGATALPPRAPTLAAIPNAKGQETNPYDTGWRTETFDLSQLGYDFDRINLILDDAEDATGTYRLYVDYIRIFTAN